MSSSLILKALRVCNDFRLPTRVSSIAQNCHSRYLPFHRQYSVTHKTSALNMAEKLLPQLFKYVDQNADSYKKLLKEAVAIPSVSCDVKYRDDCVRMVHWMQDKLKEVGASTELREVGFQTIDGKEVKLPPVLVGVLGNVSINKNILFLLISKVFKLNTMSNLEFLLNRILKRTPFASMVIWMCNLP